MHTTLKKIKKQGPCGIRPTEGGTLTGWLKLLAYLGKTKSDKEPLPFGVILKAVGIYDAVWCLRTLDYRDQCLFRADVAELVLPIFEKKYPDGNRPRKAIKAIRNFHAGKTGKSKLKTAADAYADAYAAAAVAYADAYAAAAVAYADADAYAAVDIWTNIERLFVKHFVEDE